MVRTIFLISRVLLALALRLTLQGATARLAPLNGGLAFVTSLDSRRRRHDSPFLSRFQSDRPMAPEAIAEMGGTTANGIKVDNEWGIPDSDTLEPLSPVPLQELPNGGKITLVGAGPGDPELLTMSAFRLLSDPNVMVIADRLVSDEILDLIASQDIKIARKMPGCADLAQEEIYWWTYRGIQEGKHVVRLKIGDPFVFGRGGEEVLKFRSFGVESTVIPVRCVVSYTVVGREAFRSAFESMKFSQITYLVLHQGVSAAFSAPLLGSIPVTHRGVASQVVMCTGYGRNGTSPDLIQYHKEQTVVFLMAVGRLDELCQRLISLAGYPSKTPVAIVERAGCPDQRTVVGNMETIADLSIKYNVKPPSTIIVGDVVNILLDQDDESGETVTGLIQNLTAAAV